MCTVGVSHNFLRLFALRMRPSVLLLSIRVIHRLLEVYEERAAYHKPRPAAQVHLRSLQPAGRFAGF